MQKAFLFIALLLFSIACEKPADIDKVFNALEAGQYDWVVSQVDAGFDVNQSDADGVSLLMIASKLRETSLVEALINQGADINHRTKKGITALMIAAKAGDSETVRTLLENGADTEHTTIHGWSAIILAARYGDSETLSVLESYTTKEELLAERNE
ncbi:MAG: ankyrin repeat domain-containing protein [Balneolales bacterium]